MTKDITFHRSYHNSTSSTVVVNYGEKTILRATIYDDDIMEFKALAIALQNEILKDAMKAPPTIVVQPGATVNVSQPLAQS